MGDVIISGTEHNMKLKFSMLTYLTQYKHYINQFTAIMMTHVVIENVMHCAMMTMRRHGLCLQTV